MLMKKLLTVAAMIAAGSAFAGATEYTTSGDAFVGSTSWYDGSSYGNYYGVQLTTSAITETATGTGHPSGSSFSSATVSSGETYLLSSISFALDSSGNSKAGTTYLLLVDSSFSLVAISTVATFESGQAYNSENTSGKAFNTYTFSDTYITSGSTYYVLGVTSAGATYYASLIGSTVDATTYATYASYIRVIGNSSLYETYGGVTSETTSVTASSAYGTMAASVQYTLTAVTAVPEPSSFGLLAGIGALALVAARRRRSR